jgi:acyl carrier protein
MSADVIDVETWLREWLAKRAPGLALKPDDNYFEVAAIDSFEAITLIEDGENEFSIRFRQTDFQDRRFSTIRGFGEIVAERRHSPA